MSTRPSPAVKSLYAHVPFCASKCDYCAFYSEASQGALVNRYVDALIRELQDFRSLIEIRTLFFGGGTPSLLNLSQWEKILSALSSFSFDAAYEWTVECNPATLSKDKARLLREGGVNRVSMGVQSLNADLLDRLGRVHSRETAFKSYDILRGAGFENVNLDLMFAIPGQSLDVWSETLREALAMAPNHLSSYEVIYEEDTPLYRRLQEGEFSVDEDLAASMYERLLEAAADQGFMQYEVANFARHTGGIHVGGLPSFACRHNVNYWKGGDYFGAGPSACSRVEGKTFKNIANASVYCEKMESGRSARELEEALSPMQRAGETAAFGLRMPSGWEFEEFRKTTGFDLRLDWIEEMNRLVRQGWALMDQRRFRLNAEGLRFADAAAELFLK